MYFVHTYIVVIYQSHKNCFDYSAKMTETNAYMAALCVKLHSV